MVYQSSKKAAMVLCQFGIMGGWALSYYIAYKYEITAGIFTMNNANLWPMFVAKPYTKIHMFCLGIISAILFIEMRDFKYKKMKN